MNPLICVSSDFDVSSQSRATRSPPRRRWLGTAGPSTTGRCQSPTSPSLLKASSRSTPTPSSNTRPWWGRRYPTHTLPPWWSSRSPGTSPTTQVRGLKKFFCVLPWTPEVKEPRGESSLFFVFLFLFFLLPERYHFRNGRRHERRGWRLLSLPIIRAGDLVLPGVCTGHHFLWCSNRKEGGAKPGHNPKSALPRLSAPFS